MRPTPSMSIHHARPPLPATLALLVGLMPSCLTPSTESPGEPYTPPPVQEPDAIGFYLTKLDNQLKAWTNLKLASVSDRERRALRSLERELAQSTLQRKDELLAELESHSPKNRAVATVALGFSGDPQVVGPLLNALADPDPMVSHNALIGLGVMASPNTPLARICFILTTSGDPYTRNNAAFAMAAIIAAGGDDACALPSCRQALIDDEPGVRAQAATILGMLNDLDSIQTLGDLLYDGTPLVAHASAAALSAIGRESIEQKGKVARLMVDAAVRRSQELSDRILAEVRRMTDNDYADDLKLWTEWAYRLP